MKTNFTELFMFAGMMAVLFSCDNDENGPSGKYSNGIFISNEGAFGAGNASVSFYSTTGDSIVNDIFFNENNRPLGDVLQSALNYDGKTYLVVNASGKIEVVNSEDFSEQDVIESLENPRFITEKNGMLYVTQWGEGGTVKIIDPNSNEIVETIQVGTGPEIILSSADYIIVANKGGYGEDSTISIIDPGSNEVVKTIQTGNKPSDMVIDSNGDLWVLNSGTTIWNDDYSQVLGHKPSSLVKISLSSLEITEKIELYSDDHPSILEISPDGQTLYIGGGFIAAGIFEIDINSPSVPSTPLISKSFYNVKVNPLTSEIYGFDAKDWTNAGSFSRYSLSGNLIEEYEAGVGPNGVAL